MTRTAVFQLQIFPPLQAPCIVQMVQRVSKSRGPGTFQLQPCLTGKLVELRPLGPEDWDDLFGVASDPLIWEQHPACDRYKEDVYNHSFQKAMYSGVALSFLYR